MKAKTLIAIVFLVIVFSCQTEQEKIKDEVNSFKIFTDSILRVNEEFINGVDTFYVNNNDLYDPEETVSDFILPHSNIFDTSHYVSDSFELCTFQSDSISLFILPKLNKYNSMEQHLDSLKNKMDKKTLALFELIKQKMNEIKQPIK